MRFIGAATLGASLGWCAAGLVYALFIGDSDVVMVSAILSCVVGTSVGAVLLLFGQVAAYERRWHSDLRRGTATIHGPRPGEVSSTNATQELTCQLEFRAAGMVTTRAEYRASVGPMDAPRLVEGATFACQVSPAPPGRIRLWLVASSHATDLTGRYLDFRPVPSSRRRPDHSPV